MRKHRPPRNRGARHRSDQAGSQARGPAGQPAPRAAGHRPAPASADQLWLYGRHAVLAALANPFRQVHELLAVPEVAERLAGALASAMAARGADIALRAIDRSTLDLSLPAGAVHQGIAALVAPLPEPDLDAIMPPEPESAVVVVLDQVTDPQNVGAILRSADAFGANAVIVTERHAPEETGALAKSASGALERVPLVRVVNLARALDSLKSRGFWVVGLAGEAERTLAEAKLSGRVVLVLGAEGEGLRRLTREHCDLLVCLPMTGAMPSLNVSNAAAIALYELARGR